VRRSCALRLSYEEQLGDWARLRVFDLAGCG